MSVSDAIDTTTSKRPEPVTAAAGLAAIQPAARPRRRERRALRVLPPLVVGALLLGFWQLLTATGAVREYLLPPPADVARAFWRGVESGLFWEYGRTTLQESLAGFALGVAVAVPLGYGIARSRLLARALEPFVAASQALPAVAIAPILVLWMGFGYGPKIVVTFLLCIFPIVIASATGLKSTPPELVELVRSLDASRFELFRRVRFPSALPHIFVGLKVAISLAVIGAVIGEFVGAEAGLGYVIIASGSNVDTSLAFGAMVLLGVLSVALFYALVGLERLLVPWARYEER